MASSNGSLFDGVRKMFLASVGMVATTGERAGEIIDRMAERGEAAVSQGRDLNHELTRRAADATQDARDSLLRTRLELMSDEERAQFVESVRKLSDQISVEQAARASEKAARDSQAKGVHVDVLDAADAKRPSDQEQADGSATEAGGAAKSE